MQTLKLMAKSLFVGLFFLSITLTAAAQKLALGAEGGFYALPTDGVGMATLDKANCLIYGLSASYYYSDRLTINSGIVTGKYEIWSGSKYYRVPLTLSYSLTKRGMLRAKEPYKQNILYFLTLGFVPQTLEVEGGLSFGFYDGKYSHTSSQSVAEFVNGYSEPRIVSYRLTQYNAQFVPSFDLGFRWGFDLGNAHIYIRPIYSFLFKQDNLIELEDLATKKVVKGCAHSAFQLSMGLSYTF